MKYYNIITRYGCLLVVLLQISCEKVNITFGESVSGTDPNITYLENYRVDLATFKQDSFLTSSHGVISLGYHYDSVFGFVKATSFVQISLPSDNSIANSSQPVVYDSLELIIKSSGEFYGDSTKPMKINIYRLTQNIYNVNGDSYYNTSFFNYDPAQIGQQTISLYGKSGTNIHIRFSDILGQELFDKFKINAGEISTQEKFIDYFRGLYITTDSVVTNSLAYFDAPADSMLVRLSYHENGTYPQRKYLDFSYTQSRQFNNISFRHTNSNFAAFIDKKTQLIESSLSGNQSFLNTNLGASIKISFPTLLNLKELHPYIKVVKAILVIKPDAKSYRVPYQLPATLNLFATDENNYPLTGIFQEGTTNLQTGGLVIDHLYGENTYYSFDITSFINTKIGEGQFSKSALLLNSTLDNLDKGLQRLIVNNQSIPGALQLKLYVLGL